MDRGVKLLLMARAQQSLLAGSKAGSALPILRLLREKCNLSASYPMAPTSVKYPASPGESPDTSTAKTVSNSCTQRTSNSPTKQKIATPISIKSRGVSLPILCTSIGMSG